jgi:hypothetical protein
MKNLLMTIMVAAALSACGHRTSQQATDDTDEVVTEFSTDSIGLEREDSLVSIKVSADWPTSGNDTLVSSIRQYICEELAARPWQEGQPEVKLTDDGKKLVETTVKEQYDELAQMGNEARQEGYGYGMTMSSYVHVFKLEETDRYVTYLSNSEGFMGGAHGYATSTGITFSKNNGQKIGYHTEYNQQTEQFEIKDQTLFSNPKSDQLALLIKEGVRSYFKEFDAEVVDDEKLKDQLISVDDINHIPLPSNPPIFTKKGLCFTYQQYEIAPYAAGMINFDIPYDKIRPHLTPDAQALID